MAVYRRQTAQPRAFHWGRAKAREMASIDEYFGAVAAPMRSPLGVSIRVMACLGRSAGTEAS